MPIAHMHTHAQNLQRSTTEYLKLATPLAALLVLAQLSAPGYSYADPQEYTTLCSQVG